MDKLKVTHGKTVEIVRPQNLVFFWFLQKFKSSLRPLVDTSYSFSDIHENAALENGATGDDVHKPPAYELSVRSQKV